MKNIFRKLFPCRFAEEKCKDNFLGCKCGKSPKVSIQQPPPAPPPPPPPDPVDVAKRTEEARQELDPQSAKREFDILTSPEFGLGPRTRFLEQTRAELFPLEQAVREQLARNITANLSTATGLTPEQDAAIAARRGDAQNELVRAMRERANLGGGLFGGRSQLAEQRALQDLQNQFVEEDIARQERARLNAIQSAIPLLQVLFPEVALNPPIFESSVPSSTNALNAALAARGQDVSNLASFRDFTGQQIASRNQMLGDLFKSVGSVASNLPFMKCWVAAEVFSGWYKPKTIHVRYWMTFHAPTQIRQFYVRHGERIAEVLRRKPLLKLLVRPLFEVLAFLGKWRGDRCLN